MERTIIDGLKMPGYCGGIVEVAKGLWIKRDAVKLAKLLDYAQKLDVGAIYWRLGFRLETFGIGNDATLDALLEMFSEVFAWARTESGIVFELARKEPDGDCHRQERLWQISL